MVERYILLRFQDDIKQRNNIAFIAVNNNLTFPQQFVNITCLVTYQTSNGNNVFAKYLYDKPKNKLRWLLTS